MIRKVGEPEDWKAGKMEEWTCEPQSSKLPIHGSSNLPAFDSSITQKDV
jgi:hypothetical protein